jgi:dolichol-phosphate mannosyltransferase
MDYARGDAVVIIDADLQDPPEVILELAKKWKEGYEVVYAVRAEREGETKFKLWTASLFYRLIYRITDVKIPLDTGDFRLIDRKVVEVMNRMREKHRFLRGMGAWVGFKQVGVEYKRAARYSGETKYPLKKMLRLAINAITGFSYFPLQLATYFGFISAGLAIFAIPIIVTLRLAGETHFFEGQTTTLVAVLFLGGVQLISLGILGEYIGRIYDEAKGRPLYIVRDAPKKE